jgi:hypothetical protein
LFAVGIVTLPQPDSPRI